MACLAVDGHRAWRVDVSIHIFRQDMYLTILIRIHCHILQHMVMGMQTVWVMGNSSNVMAHPYEHVKGYLEYGGGVYGNDTHDPSSIHFKGLGKIGRWFS